MNQKIYKTKDEIHQLFTESGLVYLKRTRVEWQPLLSKKLDKSPYYKENKETFEDLSKKYDRSVNNAEMAPVYIKWIDNGVGFGVFAAEDIKKDAFIGEYAGVVQVFDEDEETGDADKGYSTDYSWYYLDDIKDGPVLEINGKYEGNEMRFVNHGKKPNVDVEHMLHQGQWVIFFKASRKIRKNEQLLISYGEEYWNDGYRELAQI
ncbi:MAG: SET domain-containing protein-lysine N-methyltransferase [Proteobacteria bacterium]|nr:SET domain-containing protein-lysine N-methyltransferase [Pseudomonadota bacterium]